jgi:hypothetical protein
LSSSNVPHRSRHLKQQTSSKFRAGNPEADPQSSERAEDNLSGGPLVVNLGWLPPRACGATFISTAPCEMFGRIPEAACLPLTAEGVRPHAPETNGITLNE